MEAVVKKWGNSFGIRIPKFIMDKLELEDGACLELSTEDGKLILNPVEKKMSLNYLIEGMDNFNVLDQFDDENDLGKEIVPE